MKANFYPQLTLKDRRRKVDAAGPLNWEEIPAEVGRLAIVAVVTQNGVRGRGTSREYRREDQEREWWCEVEVETGDAFAPGPAPVRRHAVRDASRRDHAVAVAGRSRARRRVAASASGGTGRDEEVHEIRRVRSA